ncbi:ABC transporter permease [Sediminibacillus dalangtanensis]|uniref:ABC transporter permease n=1 Tax=Sediminibacillus dalangtanensis TaxID=2729421 RepID=A0ABX7VXM4_9BACI|nr:ABC transporter permease [Sediminibacillus dalangtanensis]QTM99072.1 ABC transporter permease [Sediminibacillus dalangtanensis]
MLSFLKKDVVVLLRDRTELLVLLLMPIILTVILGFALKGMFAGGFTSFDMKVAVVDHNNRNAGVEQFTEEVRQLSIPVEAKDQLIKAAESSEPSAMLMNMLEDEELGQVMETEKMNENKAEEALDDGEVTALLKIPENFTYLTLKRMLLDQGKGAELEMVEGKDSSLMSGIFYDTVERFVRTFNFETAIAQAADGTEVTSKLSEGKQDDLGGVITVTDQEPISSIEYYSIGMAVMFAMFVASTIASKAYVENYQNVFSRILLSGKHPLLYLSGKAISTTVLVFMQLVLLFGMGRLLLQAFADNSWQFWLGMLVIGAVFSLCIGALGALLTAITVKSESNVVPGIFAGGIVTVLAMLGGSFFPVSGMPALFTTLGNWTPNGIMLNMTLQWAQGLGTSYILPLIFRLLLLTVVLIAVSLLIFSKRRAA